MSKENEKVQNSAEKAVTYKAMTARYKLAMKHGFLYEALLHGQTILEDRLDAFLWAAGVIAEPDGTSLGNRRTRPLLTEIICKYTETAKPAPLRSIGGKTAAVRALLLFANDTPAPEDRYLAALAEGLRALDIDALLAVLAQIDNWRSYRNTLLHAAPNKDIYTVTEDLAHNAALVGDLAGALNDAARALGRRTKIRLAARMPKNK